MLKTKGLTWDIVDAGKDLYNNGCSHPCPCCRTSIVFDEPSLGHVSILVDCPTCAAEVQVHPIRVFELKIYFRLGTHTMVVHDAYPKIMMAIHAIYEMGLGCDRTEDVAKRKPCECNSEYLLVYVRQRHDNEN